MVMSDDLKERLRDRRVCSLAHNSCRNDWVCEQAADRIEELEAANKRLNEQMDAIEEMGTESLNALPDCLMRLAPALVENEELKAKLAKAVEALERVMVGGNHLATLLPDNFPPTETEPLIALDMMGYGYRYEVWCCWRSIMLARATLAELKGQDDEYAAKWED